MAKIKDVGAEEVREQEKPVKQSLTGYLINHPSIPPHESLILRLCHVMEVHTDAEWSALNREHASKQRFSD